MGVGGENVYEESHQKSNKDTRTQTWVLYQWRLKEGTLTAATFANKPLHVGQITSLARILCWRLVPEAEPEARPRETLWLAETRQNFTCTPPGHQK